MRSVLFIFAALVSLIYAADPVGTWKSPCMGPTPITVGSTTYQLYNIETRTLADGKQFESESYYYFNDNTCAQPVIIGRIQGTFTTSGTVSENLFYPPISSPTPVTGIDVQGITVERTHYFVTSLDATVSQMLQGLCSLPTQPEPFVAFDLQQDGCLGLGIIGNDTCTTYLDLYFQQPGGIMNFGVGFGNYQTCGTRNALFNPLNYTSLAAPTLASGKYELGCTQFATSPIALWNTYFLELTATTGTTGKYSLTSNTFNAATCAQSALFSTTVLSATYTVDGYGVVENYMMDGKRPIQLNLVFTSKTATPKTTLSVGGLTGYCPSATFTLNQATELNTIGCTDLGFPPNSLCQSKHFDIVQEKLDTSGFYPGGATEFMTHCSADKRVDTVSSKTWTTYVEPTPTVTPSPTSSSSSLAANVLLLISLLVFVLHF